MKLLTDAAENAVTVVAYNQAYHAQLALIDRKTKLICHRFMTTPDMEPVERELIAEDLLGLQKARSKVVALVRELNLIS